MSCFGCMRRSLAGIQRQQKYAFNINCTRRSFTRATNSSQLSRSFKLLGVIAGGTSVIGFAVVYSSGPEEPKKKLVILGSGWGAVSLIKSLTPGKYDVSVVSPHNYFLFTPLLPSVTVGTVEGRSVTEPIRKILFRRHVDATFYEAACTRVNAEDCTVECTDSTGSYSVHSIALGKMIPGNEVMKL